MLNEVLLCVVMAARQSMLLLAQPAVLHTHRHTNQLEAAAAAHTGICECSVDSLWTRRGGQRDSKQVLKQMKTSYNYALYMYYLIISGLRFPCLRFE